MWTERWFLSCNAKDIGTCAARSCVYWLNVMRFAFSDTVGVLIYNMYSFYGVDLGKANNPLKVIADVKCEYGGGLPRLYLLIKKFWHGYDKKLDTYRPSWIRLWVLSRICRLMYSIATKGCSDSRGCRQTVGHSSEESSEKACAQEPKSEDTSIPGGGGGEDPRKTGDKSKCTRKPSDPSASVNKRGRSSHSSQIQKVKGNSEGAPAQKQKSRSKVSNLNLRTFVTNRLDNYKNKEEKYNGLIRILADVAFLQYCWLLIKGNPGNMTKGATAETLDGLTYEWFVQLADDLKTGKFKFSPARRVAIPKPGKSEKRYLGVGSPREKIVQKGLQVILNAIYEPIFLNCSHGFRENRSTHSALKSLHLKAHHHSWVVQGDISKCFDKIPHRVIMERVKEKVKCEKILQLIISILRAGYIDTEHNNKWIRSKEGTPQGSVLSPLLANIVLHELDTYVEAVLAKEYNRGVRRRTNPEYNKIAVIRDPRKPYYHQHTPEERRLALEKLRGIPRNDMKDPNYRRIMYVRYADDFVVLLAGPKEEAMIIKEEIKEFLKIYIGLELNDQKTLVTNVKEGFEFLGAKITKVKPTDFVSKYHTTERKQVTMRPNVRARVNAPTKKLLDKLIKVGIARITSRGEIVGNPMTSLVNLDHATIIQYYNSKMYGVINYYTFAGNRTELLNLIWLMKWSLARTLARKYQLRSARQAFKKFGNRLRDPETDLELKAPNSLPVIHQYNTVENQPPVSETLEQTWYSRLTQNSLFKKCVLCGTAEKIEMHRLRSVLNVRVKMANQKASFAQWKGAVQRKQIPLCKYHHESYHHGKLLNYELNQISRYSENLSSTAYGDSKKKK